MLFLVSDSVKILRSNFQAFSFVLLFRYLGLDGVVVTPGVDGLVDGMSLSGVGGFSKILKLRNLPYLQANIT